MAATAGSFVNHLSAEKSTATGAALAETCNAQCGLITTEALTTATTVTIERTLTNSFIATGSILIVWMQGGTNNRFGVIVNVRSVSAGSALIEITNSHANSLNGTLVYGFLVL